MQKQGIHEGSGYCFMFWGRHYEINHLPEVILTADCHPTRDPLDVRELQLILAKTNNKKNNVMVTKIQFLVFTKQKESYFNS